MVSEGMLAITDFVENLSEEQVPILKYASMRVRRQIEDYVNVQRGIALPSRSTQERVDPLEAEGVVNIGDVDEPGEEDERLKTVDMVDALEHLNLKCALSKAFLQPETWARTNAELAIEYGISESTVSRTRTELYNQYKDLLNG
jgi:DNA-directed RNA polymerase specialized sigma subunit